MIHNPGVAFSGTTTTDNALVRWDGATGRFIQNSVGILTDDGFLTGLLGVTPADTDITFYANSSTGSDSYDGTSATFVSGTIGPKLTLDGTNGLFSIIPLVGPGIVTLNLTGTFTRSSTTVYRLPAIFNKKGDSDYPSIVRVTGDVANPSNVILRNFSSTGSMFSASVATNLWDFDGVTFDDGRVGVNVPGGYVRFKNVYATNIRDGGPYFQSSRGGILALGAATGALTFACNATGSTTAIVFATQIYGYIDWQPNQTVTISGVKNNSGMSIGNFGRLVHTNGTIIINGDATVGGDVGIQVTGFGFVTARNITIDKMTNASSTRQCGVYLTDSFASWLQVGGTALTVTNSTRGIFLTPLSKWRDSSAATYTFTTVTTPVTISHSAVADSSNAFSGAAITYTPGGYTAAIHGYDDRYMMTDRPTLKRTAVADAAYTVLTTDVVVSYTSLTAARAITLPAVSSATSGITTGDIRVFSFVDESGNCSAVNTLTLSVAGGGTINGAASFVMNVANAKQSVYCIAGGSNAYFTF